MSLSVLEAVVAGDPEHVSTALAADPGAAHARGPDGVSALMLAIYHRRPDIAELIRVARGGDVDPFEAAALGDGDRLRAALDADPGLTGARSPDGFSLLHLASFFGQAHLVALLLERGAHPSVVADNAIRVQPLHSATAAHSLPAVRALLAAGADPDAKQTGGHTALHAAALHGMHAIVAALMDAGADPTVADDEGVTAAGYATRGGHPDLASTLGG